MNVPFCDLSVQHKALEAEIESAIRRVMGSSAFILGPEVSCFEESFAAYIGVRHAIGTSSGSTALIVALKALGVGAGDEVLVPAMTFYATGEAVAFLGAKPVFVDVDPVTFNIDVRAIRAAITPRTKVILPVHLYGQPAAVDEIRSIALAHGLRVLGDCAHAHGAMSRGRRVGSIEDIAAFSFYPSKNLGGIGEAGMITTNDDGLAEACRRFRDHGSTRKYEHETIGLNARLSAIQAAVLSVKLPFLDEWNQQRRAIARFYSEALKELPMDLPQEAGDGTHVYHVYQIRLDERDDLAASLTAMGIGVAKHYPVAMHLHKGFAYLRHRPGDFPVAEDLARRTLSLPCYPGMSEEQQVRVVSAVKQRLAAMCV